MTTNKFNYTIGDKPWTQRPLVLGQWKQLMEIIKGLAIPAGADIPQLLAVLGTRVPLALAVILIEEGSSLRARFGLRTVPGFAGIPMPEWYQNQDVMLEIANEIEAGINAETIMRVIDDFLSCNPVSSILERLSGVLMNTGKIQKMMATGSTSLSPSSPEAISQEGITSSGDSLPENASPTSSTTAENSSSVSP